MKFLFLALVATLFTTTFAQDFGYCPCSLNPGHNCSFEPPLKNERGEIVITSSLMRKNLEKFFYLTSEEVEGVNAALNHPIGGGRGVGVDVRQQPNLSCANCEFTVALLQASVSKCCDGCDADPNYNCECNGLTNYCKRTFAFKPLKVFFLLLLLLLLFCFVFVFDVCVLLFLWGFQRLISSFPLFFFSFLSPPPPPPPLHQMTQCLFVIQNMDPQTFAILENDMITPETICAAGGACP